MTTAMTGSVLQIQGFSVNDGEGIRTVIFLAGCPLRCLWCSNPETWTTAPKIAVYGHKCVQCRTCEQVCPEGLSPPTLHANNKTQHCTACGACVEVCPQGALGSLIQTMTVKDILEQIERDAIFFRASGGGVTFSGGEPTFQLPFLRSLSQGLYDAGISLAIETCGYFDWERARDIFENMHHVFLDMKHMDERIHRDLTGVSNEIILQNAQHIHDTGVSLTIRIPVIPDINGTPENFSATADFLKTKLPHASLELLPYHDLGKEKYEAIGLQGHISNFIIPDEKFMRKAESFFRENGIPLQHFR